MAKSCHILFLGFLSALAPAQELLVSLTSDLTASGVSYAAREVFAFSPVSGLRAVLPRESLPVLFGDRDQDGLLDDAPTNIDALHAGSSDITTWFFSVSANLTISGGTTIRDGDIIQISPQGALGIAFSEDLFATATGTATVDIDAFAIGPAGEIYFSFADDEVSTSTAMIAANGGNATLDEQCVFRIAQGQTLATLHLTQAQVVAAFNIALNAAATTVVDTTGIEIDPLGASGDLLLICGSTSAALRSRIVSTRNGGIVPAFGGINYDPMQLGLGTAGSLDALAQIPTAAAANLRITPDAGSSLGTPATLSVGPLPTGSLVQLSATFPRLTSPAAFSYGGTNGFGLIYLDASDPLLLATLASPAWRLIVDLSGRATYAFDYVGMPVNGQAVVQAIDVTTLALTPPAVLTVLP